MRILTGLCACLLLCVNASADELDLGFNSDTVRARYVHDFADSDLTGDLGFVNDSDRGTAFTGSLFVQGLASGGEEPLQAGLGLRAGYVDGDAPKQSGYPLAVGAFFRYAIPAMDRLSLRGSAWFSPKVLSLGNLDKYEDYSVRLQYALLREADIFVGANYVNADFNNGTHARLDNGLNVGFNIRF